MPFGLTIGTDRALALQNSIQDELTARGYSPDADPVMAEYITIMIINNKTPAQITAELEDLIGTDYDHTFTDWLFLEAAKGASDSDSAPLLQPSSSNQPPDHTPPLSDSSRRLSTAPRGPAPLYQQAISQTFPSTPSSSQKRTSSARSPSPGHSNKSRRIDLPTGPRAMLREHNPNSRSLLERVGGPPRNTHPANRFQRDDIQARIDSITGSSPDIIPPGFPQMNGMDMNQIGIANPLVFQEMMMNQMALMAQMASTMGMLNNPAAAQFPGPPGFPIQGPMMPGDMGIYPAPGMNGFAQPSQPHMSGPNGTGRGARQSRARSDLPLSHNINTTEESVNSAPNQTISAPAPVLASSSTLVPSDTPVPTATPQPRSGPERPQSPTLCKFGFKCTNPYCRYSHPSPVATAESGVVLSNEACENGKACKDKDCIKAHVSPASLTAPAASEPPTTITTAFVPPAAPTHSPVVCRFGSACTRPNCAFLHPTPRLFDHHHHPHHPHPHLHHHKNEQHFAQQCRFGAACTRATCPFQHPEGRVLPSTFHRGLSATAPLVSVPTPETGSMGSGSGSGGSGPSPHKSVTFNNAHAEGGAGAAKRVGEGVKAQLERQMKEIEEKKSEAEQAVKEAEEAVAGKKQESTAVAIAA